MLLALSLAAGVVLIALAVRQLRRGRSLRAGVAVVLAALLLLSGAALQKNRVTQGPLTWDGVAATIWPKPIAAPSAKPLTKKEGKADGILSDTGEGWIAPKLAKAWGKAPNPEYKADLKEFHPEGAGTTGTYFTTTWKGPQSGLKMDVIVWAPKGWQKLHGLGVIEMLHGYPGGISGVPAAMKFDQQMTDYIAKNLIQPSVIVLPLLRPDGAPTRAFDFPGEPKVGTWAARDIPAMIANNFPVSRAKDMWTLAGVSEGGYTAPALAVLARDTFGAAVSLSGTNNAEYGPLAQAPEDVQAQMALTSLLSKAPDLAVYAYSGGAEPKSNKLLTQLAAMAKRPGVTTLFRDAGRGHGWDTWKHAFPGVMKWVGSVQKNKAKTEVAAVAKPPAKSAPVAAEEKNMHGIYAVTGAASALALALFGWRVWIWRRRSAADDGVAARRGVPVGRHGSETVNKASNENGGSSMAAEPARVGIGAKVARFIGWDMLATVLVVAAVFVWLVLALNLWGQWLRSEEDILGLLIQLGLPYDG